MVDLTTRKPTPMRLTDSPARKKYPQFSPDGKYLAVLVVDGTKTRVNVIDLKTRQIKDFGFGDDILWSYDSGFIVSRDSKEIFTLAVPNGARKKLVTSSKASKSSMRWHGRRGSLSILYIQNGDIWKVGVNGTSAVGAPKRLTNADAFYKGVNFTALAVDPSSKPGEERFIGILNYSALAITMSDKGVLYAPGQKPLDIGKMNDIFWPASGGYIYDRNGSLFQKNGKNPPVRVAGVGNGAGEPVLARDGWLYFSAYQPERKTSGSVIRPKYGEIYRTRLRAP